MKQLLNTAAAKVLPFLLGSNNRQFTILVYRHVLEKHDPLRPKEPTKAEFANQMQILAKHFNPLPLEKAVERIKDKTLPPKAVCVTFDRGYATTESLALPILSRCNIPSTIFIAPNYLNGAILWQDEVIELIRNAPETGIDLKALGLKKYDTHDPSNKYDTALSIIREIKHWTKERRLEVINALTKIATTNHAAAHLMLTVEQIKHLSNTGMDIGIQPANHSTLATLSLSGAKDEIEQSQQAIALMIGKPASCLAYPGGRPDIDYHLDHRDIAEISGLSCAVTRMAGAVTETTDIWQLPRISPRRNTDLRFIRQILGA